MAGYRFGNQAQFGTGNTISGTLGVTMGTGNTLSAGTDSCLVGGSGNTLESGAKYSMVFGKGNTLSGTYSPTGTWVGGSGNVVNADYSLVMGRDNVMPSGTAYSIWSGRDITGDATADYTAAFGDTLGVSGSKSLYVGNGNIGTTGSDNSFMCGRDNLLYINAMMGGFSNVGGVGLDSLDVHNEYRGKNGLIQGKDGVGRFYAGHTIGGSKFSTDGDAQTTRAIPKAQTTDATATTMTCGEAFTGTMSSAGEHFLFLQDQSAVVFKAHIIARQTNADDVGAAWVLEGAIDRNTGVATTDLLGSVNKTLIHSDVGTWDVNATADTTNGALDIKVTGAASDNVNWVCNLDWTEVVG